MKGYTIIYHLYLFIYLFMYVFISAWTSTPNDIQYRVVFIYFGKNWI